MSQDQSSAPDRASDPAQGQTPLALALARMQAAPQNDAARLAFYGVLADSELFLMLAEEAQPGQLSPRLFDLEMGHAALVFDSEARLAGFAGQAVDYAALPGRVLAGMLARQALSMMVNPDSPDATLLPPDALHWLAETLAQTAAAPTMAGTRPLGFAPPDMAADALALLRPALERRLSGVPGLKGAVLAQAHWADGHNGTVLALAGVPASAHAAMARAVAEALALSGLDEGALDVVFPDAGAMASVAAAGLALSPAPHNPQPPRTHRPAAPGTDPTRPPRLR